MIENKLNIDENGRIRRILIVDDEPYILSALKRCLRSLDVEILSADNGINALEVLKTEQVDIILSDLRMPEMDGATLFSSVANLYPQTKRILLTGYADLDSIQDAINNGHIYSLIAKPWDNQNVLLILQRTLKTIQLEEENKKLLDMTERQNKELKRINSDLQIKVDEKVLSLKETQKKLRKIFTDVLPLYTNLIDVQHGLKLGMTHRFGEIASEIAYRLKLEFSEIQAIYFSGLLQNIGITLLPEKILNKAYVMMSVDEKEQFHRHPGLSEMLLMGHKQLKEPANIIRCIHEHCDGSGFPDGKMADEIPLGSKIILVLNHYQRLQNGNLVNKKLTPEQARQFLVHHRHDYYESKIVHVFLDVLEKHNNEIEINSENLMSGMVLSQDLIAFNSLHMLSKNQKITTEIIHHIKSFEKEVGNQFLIFVNSNIDEFE
ncbi:MAG: response regulator [Methylococcales bacterium]|nr:response regulator [Methylococcales bacterium]MBT7409166.1 response regulator [Methylococcales bacterium]